MVRAKFRCHAITLIGGQETGVPGSIKVELGPVYSADKTTENYAFWKASPNGKLEMYIDNPAAFPHFVIGQEYYLDFTPAPVR